MKQRLGIAAALLTDPELLLLDEPTTGLDPAGMVEIRQLIQRLKTLGKTIFLSSHLLNEVQQVCNRVAILQKGNLIKQGNVRELLRSREQVLVRLRAADELARCWNRPGRMAHTGSARCIRNAMRTARSCCASTRPARIPPR
jgi:ABC-2 type transport system ATP-binding protein